MSKQQMTLIAKIEETNENKMRITYEALSGERTLWIPRGSVHQMMGVGEDMMMIVLSDTTTTAGEFLVTEEFADNYSPNIPADYVKAVDALEQGNFAAAWTALTGETTSEIETVLSSTSTTVAQTYTGADGQDILDVWGTTLAGGRDKKVCDWNFIPIVLPLQALEQGVNKANGDPALFAGFNPNYQTADRPLGAFLGAYSDRYHAGSYPERAGPMLQRATEAGWLASAIAYDEGKKFRADFDLTDTMETVTKWQQGLIDKKEAAAIVGGLSNMYRIGVTMLDSLDGRGSVKLQVVCVRMKCLNGQTLTKAQNVAALRHMRGVLKDTDWDAYSYQVGNMMMEGQLSLLNMETLKGVSLDQKMFDQLMFLATKHGLFQVPKVAKNGTQLIGGHLYEAAHEGFYTGARQHWVNVEPGETGTAFHALQAFTGALTHRPEIQPTTWSGKRRILGGQSLSLGRYQTLQDKTGKLFNTWYKLIREEASKQGVSGLSISDMREWSRTLELDVPLLSEVAVA